MNRAQLAKRDQAEVKRSAEEARQGVLRRAEVERYLDPPHDTAYPLEYAFHLLGDVRGKTVLDIGCGTGQNTVVLVRRGAHVIAMDISPELVALAERRLRIAGRDEVALKVGSAYDTGIPSQSVDVIFCIYLIHHLDIVEVRKEMRRILARDGRIIVSEPIRFSKVYNRLRILFPAGDDISQYEHPLTRHELDKFTEFFRVERSRYFRLPLLPLSDRILPRGSSRKWLWRTDRWILQYSPLAGRYATNVTMSLRRGD